MSNKLGEKKQVDQVIQFKGEPLNPDQKNETTRWKKFLKWINPIVKKGEKAIQLSEGYYEAEVDKNINQATKVGEEATKIAEESASIAAETERKKIDKVKAINDEIARIFSSNELPTQAKLLQFETLASEFPEIKEKMDSIIEKINTLNTINFVEIEITTQKKKLNTNPNEQST